MTPQELVAAACPRIGKIGPTFYFAPETAAQGEKLGLDVFEFYFLGRGGVLGDVEARVVTSAFGYFKPQLVEAMWNTGRAKISPRDAGRAFLECCREWGRARFSHLEGLEAFCEAAGAVNAAADPIGLTLYAGISAEPLEDDLPGRAMQLVTVLRELRGSAHLLAVLACDVRPVVAHYVRRPDFFGIFGWSDEDVPVVTAEDHAALDAADELTDHLVLPAYSVVDDAGAEALLSGLVAMEAALASS
jgi:hypothetical protein